MLNITFISVIIPQLHLESYFFRLLTLKMRASISLALSMPPLAARLKVLSPLL